MYDIIIFAFFLACFLGVLMRKRCSTSSNKKRPKDTKAKGEKESHQVMESNDAFNKTVDQLGKCFVIAQDTVFKRGCGREIREEYWNRCETELNDPIVKNVKMLTETIMEKLD